jgi:SAM-dependent methyltransferase
VSTPTIPLDTIATAENFDEAGYLCLNPDVAANVRSAAPDRWQSGRQHFDAIGYQEGRRLRQLDAIRKARAPKMAKLRPHLLRQMKHTVRDDKYDFLSADLRSQTKITDTQLVSSNDYDINVLAMLEEYPDGLILDCGAGQRHMYYSNVVNYEIVDYATTDVLGVGEVLPFKDGTFDGVISMAVLEHVRDPFKCASELKRVLKRGGKLLCCVPFLQPYHGYPNHYFNMTHQGLRSLFEDAIEIDSHFVFYSMLPIWSLTWIVQSWADGLPEHAKNEFLDVPLRDLLANPLTLLDRSWVKELSNSKILELASATLLIGHKR